MLVIKLETPDINTSLLLRGQSDYDPIEWITETVPAYYSGEFISFIWLFGMDVTADPVEFMLSINEQTWFTFIRSKTSDLGSRIITGEDGAPLLYRLMLPSVEAQNTKLVSRSLLNLDAKKLFLVNARPSVDGRGIILHLREVEGDHAIVDILRILEETGASSISEVNILEEELDQLTGPLLIEHYETKFFKLNFGGQE